MVMLGQMAAVRFRHVAAVGDAQQRIVGLVHVGRREIGVVGGYQRDVAVIGQFQPPRFDLAFEGKPMPLKLDIEPPGEHCVQPVAHFFRRRKLAVAEQATERPVRPAREADQPVRARRQFFKRRMGIAVFGGQKGIR